MIFAQVTSEPGMLYIMYKETPAHGPEVGTGDQNGNSGTKWEQKGNNVL
jgi:hypothetical protein